MATSDIARWEARLLDGSGVVSTAELDAAAHGWNGGDVDRATWRVTTKSGKFELLPDLIADALRTLGPPVAGPQAHWLLTSAARDPAIRRFDRVGAPDPGVTLHPSAGFLEGERVRVRTTAGAVEAVVHLDPSLREDVVDLPAGYEVDVNALIPTSSLDRLTGTPASNGLICSLERP